MRLLLFIILFVPLQFVRAQTLITLAPQSSCANGVFVDYIAKACIDANKTNVILLGDVFTNYDSIASISFIIEKSLVTIDEKKEKLRVAFGKLRLGKNEGQLQNDTAIAINNLNCINNKELSIEVFLPKKSLGKHVKIELSCYIVFKNECRYLRKYLLKL